MMIYANIIVTKAHIVLDIRFYYMFDTILITTFASNIILKLFYTFIENYNTLSLKENS